jgi:hypothetical protein
MKQFRVFNIRKQEYVNSSSFTLYEDGSLWDNDTDELIDPVFYSIIKVEPAIHSNVPETEVRKLLLKDLE